MVKEKKISDAMQIIARLEDSEYDGHSLGILCRIATALHMRLEIRLIPDQEAA